MTAIDAVADAAVRAALRRWPVELRSELALEWGAELHVLRRQSGALGRAYQQLRFGLSLAARRPGDLDGGRTPWRETAFGEPGLIPRVLALLVVPYLGARLIMLASVLTGVMGRWLMTPLRPTTVLGNAATLTLTWLGVAAGVALVALIARAVIRPAAGPVGHRGPLARAVIPTTALAIGTAIGAYVNDAVATRNGQVWYLLDAAIVGTGVAAWAVLMLVLGRLITRMAARNPRRAALVSIPAGALLVLLAILATITPALLRYGSEYGSSVQWLLAGGITESGRPLESRFLKSLPHMFMACTAVMTVFALRRRAVRLAEPEAPATTTARAVRTRGALDWLAPAAIAVGLASWAYLLLVVTPAARRAIEGDDWTEEKSQYLAWAHDARIAALLLIGLGLFALMRARVATLAGAALAGIALMAADAVVDVQRLDISHAELVMGAGLVVALVIAVGATQLARAQSTGARQLVAAAVLAAYCAPTLMLRGAWTPPAFATMPAGLDAITAGLFGMLAAVAVGFALAARATPLRATVAATLLGLAGLGGGGLAYALMYGSGWTVLIVSAGPPFALAMVLLCRGLRPERRRSSAARWTVAVLVGFPLAVPLTVACVLIPEMIFGQIDIGGDHSGDAYSVLPGGLLVGAVLAMMAVSSRRRAPAPSASVLVDSGQPA